jgi:hypothetical protein
MKRRLPSFGLQFFSLLALVFVAFSPLRADEPQFTEYEVKAAFIYNIAKFVEWPQTYLPDLKSAVNFCVLGTDPFGKALSQIEGKNVKDRKLQVKHVATIKDSRNCHMLFISSSEKEQVSRVVESLKDTATLTIGDVAGFARQGVMINFYMENSRIRFEVNTERSKRSKVVISSQLLKLARIVQGEQ